MRNVRKHILINPAFQMKFALLFTLAVSVFASIFPLFVYTLFESMESHTLFSKSSAAIQALREARGDMMVFFFVMMVVTMLTAFLLALFHSHRIAGPLYKLRMSM